jgi:hypothetical protein
VDVVEVLALPAVVVEAAEDDQVALDEDHAVATSRRGSAHRADIQMNNCN